MNVEEGRKLLADLCGGLECGEQNPLTPLARKAQRLAALLEMDGYRTLIGAHLDGVTTPKANQGPAQQTSPEPSHVQQGRKLFIHDREMQNGMIQNLPLGVVEEYHARAMRAREELGQHGIATTERDLRVILHRIRSRIGAFAIEAEKVLSAFEAQRANQLKPQFTGNPMGLLEDASLLLRMLAEFETAEGDEDRGRHNLNQHGVHATLKEKWGQDMSPARINEAVDVLETNRYVNVRRGAGTTPYKFSGVEVTASGRLQHEQMLAKTRAAAGKETGMKSKPAGTKVFIGHGGSQVWRDLKDFVRERLHLEHDEFNREPTAGHTTKERLEQMLDDAAFALLVMTGEDERADGATVARQNVIHEIGLFQGRLGFLKAIVLLEDGCEPFSNIDGLTQLRFPKGNISTQFEEIRRVLERENLLPKP